MPAVSDFQKCTTLFYGAQISHTGPSEKICVNMKIVIEECWNFAERRNRLKTNARTKQIQNFCSYLTVNTDRFHYEG
jgi:hypothetical protein